MNWVRQSVRAGTAGQLSPSHQSALEHEMTGDRLEHRRLIIHTGISTMRLVIIPPI
jgi:hypothetical protein